MSEIKGALLTLFLSMAVFGAIATACIENIQQDKGRIAAKDSEVVSMVENM
ncbi:MAG: hypothetical protein ACI32C_02500 [Candidatus Enteromonas sp.]